jgi:hypothetical protein
LHHNIIKKLTTNLFFLFVTNVFECPEHFAVLGVSSITVILELYNFEVLI